MSSHLIKDGLASKRDRLWPRERHEPARWLLACCPGPLLILLLVDSAVRLLRMKGVLRAFVGS